MSIRSVPELQLPIKLLLDGSLYGSVFSLVPSAIAPTRNDVTRLQGLFELSGFRTNVVISPRCALSVYLDSFGDFENAVDVVSVGSLVSPSPVPPPESSSSMIVTSRRFLHLMFGLASDQKLIEDAYKSIKSAYVLFLLFKRLRVLFPSDDGDAEDSSSATSSIKKCLDVAERDLNKSFLPPFSSSSSSSMTTSTKTATESILSNLISQMTSDKNSNLQPEQILREHAQISQQNSTFSNACMQIFATNNHTTIKEIYYKSSPHNRKYERLTITLYDDSIDLLKPPPFTFLPALSTVLSHTPPPTTTITTTTTTTTTTTPPSPTHFLEKLIDALVSSFWKSVLKHSYFAPPSLQNAINPHLIKFFSSGITSNPNLPLLLNAHFTPTYPISFYLYGLAGAGKSSFVRAFIPSLNDAIEANLDPEMLVKFVKQNLNKPFDQLALELQLRPNNNDLSVMSIIQGRRMTLTQTKPGLVVIDLEEMSNDVESDDPNQLKTCQLLSQRFSGRTGDFVDDSNWVAPRNSKNRGMDGDATLLTFFTSNYQLGGKCEDALKRLDMFSNLQAIEMSAVSGADRREFAKAYLVDILNERVELDKFSEIDVSIDVGEGDTRPLVRKLRMIGFYIINYIKNKPVTVTAPVTAPHSPVRLEIATSSPPPTTTIVINIGTDSIRLSLDEACNNLYSPETPIYNKVAASLLSPPLSERNKRKFARVCDYYFDKTLTPAVVVSTNRQLLRTLVDELSSSANCVHAIRNINVSKYKMMRSLYDSRETPNLRDDILNFGDGANVVIELECPNRDAQLQIREMIEDSPSMTAFSSKKSALYKDGLFFFVYCQDEITKEVESRASLVV